MSKALSLKYRPTRFSDLVGQESISQTLSLALDLDKVSHAYLFSGLRGSGKTSSARIFARALQCEHYPTSNPCGECYSCSAAANNSHIDIIEMDAASSRSIDDIKNLIEQIQYKPSLGRFKIFIIDEIHMLTKEAFNALLKTLEEPPEYVKFILATTDPLKLPATILSRTQHFRFKKIPTKSISLHLQQILDKEGVSFEESAIDLLSRNCGGSLRDALTMLEQAIIFSKNNITLNMLSDMLGSLNPSIIDEFFTAILNKNDEKIDSLLRDFEAYDVENVIDEMILFIKERHIAGDSKYNLVIIDRFFRILSEAKNLLSINSEASFVLLLSTMKLKECLNIQEIDKLIAQIEQEVLLEIDTPKMPNQAPKIAESNTQITQNAQSKITKSTQATKPQDSSISQIAADFTQDSTTSSMQNPQDSQNLAQNPLGIKSPFERFIDKIYERNYELGEVFKKNIFFDSFNDGILVWDSRAEGTDKEILRESYGLILQLAREIFGENVKIKPKNVPQNAAQDSTPKPQTQTQLGNQIETIKKVFDITEIKKEEIK